MSTDHDIVARLRVYANASIDGGWASVFRADLNIAADEIERIRAERDQTRVQVCLLAAHIKHGDKYPLSKAMEVAEKLGWDCFKENTND